MTRIDQGLASPGRTTATQFLVLLRPDRIRFFLRGAGKRVYCTQHGTATRLFGDREDWIVCHEAIDPSPAVDPVGEGKQQTRFHYYTGGRDNWRTDLRAQERIIYRNLWPGIDQEHRIDGDTLEHEFNVHPDADPASIRVAIRGADAVSLRDDGTLVIRTPNGILTDVAPVAWQRAGERRIPVDVWFIKIDRAATGDSHEVSFRLGHHDPSRTLAIDPAVIVYCGHVGGFHDDRANAMAVDAHLARRAAHRQGWKHRQPAPGRRRGEALACAGIPRPRGYAAHILRHSLAAGMICHGASLPEIAEVLRHRCPATMEIYAKVDFETLRGVAQGLAGTGVETDR